MKRCHTEQDFQKLLHLYHASSWDCDTSEWKNLVEMYFGCIHDCQNDESCPSISRACLSSKTPLFFSTDSSSQKHLPEGIILGCTHYSYLRKPLQDLFPESVIIDPSEESALKLGKYLVEHPELLEKIEKTGMIKFL